ncbi:MAG: hypothetical protein IJP68_10025 [Selenomonadaceae bacterium]|nr:hypothetical protein [Selenomonadaceae bacterium]
MNKKGMPRHGGKPLGWRKPEGVRPQRTTRAYDDEWDLILKFARMVKKGNRALCEEFIAQNYSD